MKSPMRWKAGGALGVTAGAAALMAVNVGSQSVFGLFLSPLNSATGLGIATISFAVAVNQLSRGMAQPLCGMLAERYGPARVIATGALIAAAAGVCLPFAGSAMLLTTVLAVGGIASAAGSSSLLIGAVSQRVPPRRRSMVAGIVGAGGPFGQLVLAPAAQAMISLSGWVNAALALAALSLASLPLALAFRGRSVASPALVPHPVTPLREVLASPRYWVINAAFFVCGLHVSFLVTHLPGVIELCGLPASVSGVSLAVLGLFNIAGSIGAGLVIQRYSMKLTLASLFAARGIGIALFLAAPKTASTFLVFSVWMGLTYMAVLPPIAGLIAKSFGTQRLATLLGVTFVVHQAGAFLGSWLGGVVLEATGSFGGMWVLDLTLAGLATAVCLSIREQEPRALRSVALPRLAVQA